MVSGQHRTPTAHGTSRPPRSGLRGGGCPLRSGHVRILAAACARPTAVLPPVSIYRPSAERREYTLQRRSETGCHGYPAYKAKAGTRTQKEQNPDIYPHPVRGRKKQEVRGNYPSERVGCAYMEDRPCTGLFFSFLFFSFLFFSFLLFSFLFFLFFSFLFSLFFSFLFTPDFRLVRTPTIIIVDPALPPSTGGSTPAARAGFFSFAFALAPLRLCGRGGASEHATSRTEGIHHAREARIERAINPAQATPRVYLASTHSNRRAMAALHTAKRAPGVRCVPIIRRRPTIARQRSRGWNLPPPIYSRRAPPLGQAFPHVVLLQSTGLRSWLCAGRHSPARRGRSVWLAGWLCGLT